MGFCKDFIVKNVLLITGLSPFSFALVILQGLNSHSLGEVGN